MNKWMQGTEEHHLLLRFGKQFLIQSGRQFIQVKKTVGAHDWLMLVFPFWNICFFTSLFTLVGPNILSTSAIPEDGGSHHHVN